MDNNRNNSDDLVALFDYSWFHLFILTRPAAFSSGGGGKGKCEKAVDKNMERRLMMSSLRERRSKSESIYSGCELGEESRQGRKAIKGRKERRRSKSMTELEMEEVKGFMDLGFVFCEEDKDTSLVSIIPGLNLLGENGGNDEEEEEEDDDEEVGEKKRKPYLSEVWKWRRWGDEGEALRRWKVPASGSDVEVKENLRWWAQAVASAVR